MSKSIREIVKIDEDKCDGCGLCVPDCAEGAIQVINGKAKLVAENLCDGIGNCLGSCPRGAITIENRVADEFEEDAVASHMAKTAAIEKDTEVPPLACGCPGTMMRSLETPPAAKAEPAAAACPTSGNSESKLTHWPVQLTLLPATAKLWDDADILLAADCAGFAMPDFHERLLGGKKLAVACPKLDETESYIEKLAEVFATHNVKSITIARMEVPCCGGLEQIVNQAMSRAGKTVPLNVVVISAEGKITSVNGLSVA